MYAVNSEIVNKINRIDKETIEKILKEKSKLLKEKNEEEINSHKHEPYCDQSNLKLKVAPTTILEKEEPSEYAEKIILSGKYCIQLLGAGAASRLGKGPMFGLKLSELIPETIKEKDLHPLSMGERHMLQYKTNLIALANKYDEPAAEILQNQYFIVHLNENTAKDCIAMYVNADFFGFDRSKILFCIQETHPAFTIEDNQVQNISKATYPYGHGHTLLQLAKKEEAFIINNNNEIEYLKSSILEYLNEGGVELISSHRINDLTKLSNDAICPIRVKHALEEFNKGSKLVVELVGNPHNQKGGKWLQWDNHEELSHSFLLEGLNAKSKNWKKAFQELEDTHFEETGEGIPYNAFRLMYNIQDLTTLLDTGLTPALRQRPEGLTLEITTGDITHNPESKSSGFQIKDEVIHDFKSLDNIEEANQFLFRQESNEIFDQLAKEYLEKHL